MDQDTRKRGVDGRFIEGANYEPDHEELPSDEEDDDEGSDIENLEMDGSGDTTCNWSIGRRIVELGVLSKG